MVRQVRSPEAPASLETFPRCCLPPYLPPVVAAAPRHRCGGRFATSVVGLRVVLPCVCVCVRACVWCALPPARRRDAGPAPSVRVPYEGPSLLPCPILPGPFVERRGSQQRVRRKGIRGSTHCHPEPTGLLSFSFSSPRRCELSPVSLAVFSRHCLSLSLSLS